MQRSRRNAAYWLAPPGLFSLLSYTPWNDLPRVGTIHSGSGPHTPIINLENAPQGCLQANLLGGVFSTEVPYS